MSKTEHRDGEFELCLKDKIRRLWETKEVDEKAFQAKAAARAKAQRRGRHGRVGTPCQSQSPRHRGRYGPGREGGQMGKQRPGDEGPHRS